MNYSLNPSVLADPTIRRAVRLSSYNSGPKSLAPARFRWWLAALVPIWRRRLISRRASGLATRTAIGVVVLSGLSGCVLAPEGTFEEQAKLESVSPLFEPPVEFRELPPLPARVVWREALQRAFLANGELESAYFEWKSALARVDRDATWPNTNVMLGFRYMFSPENIKTWNRVTLSGTFMPSVTLQLPIKTIAAGKVALQAAREAGERFLAAKFDLQKRVLIAYYDLALAEEKVRIQRDNLTA